MTPRRDTYADVGQAMRESISRALAADLSRSDWKVLGALLHELASWSRLEAPVYTARLETLTGLLAQNVRRSVAKLAEAGAIRREPSRGRYPSR